MKNEKYENRKDYYVDTLRIKTNILKWLGIDGLRDQWKCKNQRTIRAVTHQADGQPSVRVCPASFHSMFYMSGGVHPIQHVELAVGKKDRFE